MTIIVLFQAAHDNFFLLDRRIDAAILCLIVMLLEDLLFKLSESLD